MSVYMSTSSSCTFRANKRIISSIVHAEAMNEVLDYFSYVRIQWSFTYSPCPWQGGFYERLVDLVKQGNGTQGTS